VHVCRPLCRIAGRPFDYWQRRHRGDDDALPVLAVRERRHAARAKRIPAARIGAVEVRPLLEMGGPS
jgi:hypothetical protein